MIYRPLLWYFGSAAFGEVLAKSGGITGRLAGISLLLAVWFYIGEKEKQAGQNRSLWLLLPCFFVLGFLRYGQSLRSVQVLPERWEKQTAAVTGTVSRMEERQEEVRLILRDCRISETGKSESGESLMAGGLLVLWEREVLPEDFFAQVQEGKTIFLEAELRLPKEKRNPGQFDGRAYYQSMGISGLAQADRLLEASGGTTGLLRWLPGLRGGMRKLRRQMSGGIERVCRDHETAGLLKGMVLGEKWEVDSELRALYEECGIGHLLAISGLHVSLAGLGLFRLLRKRLGISYGISALACMGMAGCYVILTGEGSSAARAALMLAVYVLGQILGREYDVPSALGLAGLILILKNPFLIFQGGFQLSCASILALGVLYPEMKAFAEREMLQERENRGSGGKNRRGTRKGLRKRVLDLILPGLSLQLVTWPVQAHTFYQIPVYALFLNGMVLPLFSVVAVAGMICAVSGMLSGRLGEGCFWIGRGSALPAEKILKLYQWLGKQSLKLPEAIWRTGEPGRGQMIGYVLLLIFFYRWIRKKNREAQEEARRKESRRTEVRRREARRTDVRRRDKKVGKKSERRWFWILIFALPVCLIDIPKRAMEVSFLDVGQGDSCFVRTPGGTTMLIDGGSSDEGKLGSYTLGPFLDSQAVGRLDLVFVSHGDSDHISGIKELLADRRIRCLVLPFGWDNRKGLSELGREAGEQGTEILELEQGDELTIGEMKMTCLWPEKAEESENEENERSMVLWLSWRDTDVLFTGDLEGSGETAVTELLKNPPEELAVCRRSLELLKVPHHGSGKTSSEEFLKASAPEYAVISCGRKNRYGHPAEETLDRLEQAGCRIWRTDEAGAVRFWFR